MAHQESVTGLLYSVRDEIHLEVTEYEWPKEFNLNLFDFAVSFSYLGHQVTGRGVDQIEAVALEKASSEALENLICHIHKIDSVGLSVGIGYDSDAHAMFEAFERYYLNEHRTQKIKLAQHNISTALIDDFRKNNSEIEINFLKMSTVKELYGIVCILKLKNVRSVGFSFSEHEAISVNKAFIEALPNLVHLEKFDSQADKPWHLQATFIDELDSLRSEDDTNCLIKKPTLEKVNLNLSLIPFLKDTNLTASKYIVQSRLETF
jgi:hypothetical protein